MTGSKPEHNDHSEDTRPVDLNAVIELLEEEIDNGGEVGIWGDYGPPAAPLNYLVGLLHKNADAIERREGEYSEDDCCACNPIDGDDPLCPTHGSDE